MKFKNLKDLKEKFDCSLKEEYLRLQGPFGANNFPYSKDYPNYFKPWILDNLINWMTKAEYDAYNKGAGGEFKAGANGVPPKMLSIGSSSRFCYLSLYFRACASKEKTGANYFAIGNDVLKYTKFENILPIIEGRIPPHMDAYTSSKENEYFFECKCHEFFDEHPIKLAKSYFNKGLIVDSIPKEYLKSKGEYYLVNPKFLGVDNNTLVDIKQLITHLMGIIKNKKKKHAEFIYLYSVLKEYIYENKKILEVQNQLIKEIKIVFGSSFIQNICKKHNISLKCYFVYNGCWGYKISSDISKIEKIF